MYRSVYVPVDNSAHSLAGADIGITIARQQGAQLTGSHVYAAQLHDRRFRQMESGLPDQYLKEEKLIEQRDIHDDLITRGLRIITDSYLDAFAGKCDGAGVPSRRVSLEGKNWRKLVEDIEASSHDLVIMGALGLGAVEASVLGSVCERVARRIDRDLLVVKSVAADHEGAIVVAIDGSAHSYGGLKTALELGRVFKRPVEAVSAFDPFFHYVAFNSIAEVLSPEAASVFRFKEQEKLHEEIIDSGLAKIYQANLDLAAKVAADEGVELRTTLLAGKPFEQILKYANERKPWLLVMGRIGIHSDSAMDLGSNTENLLRLAGCNLLLSARSFEPALDQVAETTMAWSKEAESRMQRVPPFARGMAAKAVLKYALERGHTMITSDVIDTCLESMMPRGAKEAMTAVVAHDEKRKQAESGKCPFAHLSKAATKALAPLPWHEGAESRLAQVPAGIVRDLTRLRIEAWARKHAYREVTAEAVAGKLAEWEAAGSEYALSLGWEGAALEKMKKMSPGISAAVMQAAERFARERGRTEVTAALLQEMLNELQAGRPFHQVGA